MVFYWWRSISRGKWYLNSVLKPGNGTKQVNMLQSVSVLSRIVRARCKLVDPASLDQLGGLARPVIEKLRNPEAVAGGLLASEVEAAVPEAGHIFVCCTGCCSPGFDTLGRGTVCNCVTPGDGR